MPAQICEHGISRFGSLLFCDYTWMCALEQTLGLRTGSACPTRKRRGDPTDHGKFGLVRPGKGGVTLRLIKRTSGQINFRRLLMITSNQQNKTSKMEIKKLCFTIFVIFLSSCSSKIEQISLCLDGEDSPLRKITSDYLDSDGVLVVYKKFYINDDSVDFRYSLIVKNKKVFVCMGKNYKFEYLDLSSSKYVKITSNNFPGINSNMKFIQKNKFSFYKDSLYVFFGNDIGIIIEQPCYFYYDSRFRLIRQTSSYGSSWIVCTKLGN